jgi:hypothetical protein
MERLFNLENRLKNLERIKICLGTDTDLRRVNKLIKQTEKKIKYYGNHIQQTIYRTEV